MANKDRSDGLSSCADPAAQPSSMPDHADVVIVGAGFAGLMAAIRAVETGASVLILEKRMACGGNSNISHGALMATNSQLQKQAGISDRANLLLDDMLKAGGKANDIELAKTVAENAASVCDFLSHDLKIPFNQKIYQFAGHGTARGAVPQSEAGTTLIKAMLKRLRESEVQPWTSWQMTDFIVSDSGSVTGVKVKRSYKGKNLSSSQASHRTYELARL